MLTQDTHAHTRSKNMRKKKFRKISRRNFLAILKPKLFAMGHMQKYEHANLCSEY